MSEEDWLAGDAPHSMFEYVCRGSSARKARLFAVACARRVQEGWGKDRFRRAIELSELYADGVIPYSQLKDLFSDGAYPSTSELNVAWHCTRLGKVQAPQLVAAFARDLAVIRYKRDFLTESSAQSGIIHDIFGNPFRPISFDPCWHTSDVLGLARAIYEDRAFDRLPILADALMDAGCADEQVLGHCRGDGPHVRGCWVVDLVLGKE